MDRHFQSISFVSLFFVAVVSDAAAGDLTIMDSLGMSRAARSGVGQAVVIVEAEQAGDIPVLKNVDGLNGDILGRWAESPKGFRFDGVAAGTWKLDTTREVRKVQILPKK